MKHAAAKGHSVMFSMLDQPLGFLNTAIVERIYKVRFRCWIEFDFVTVMTWLLTDFLSLEPEAGDFTV